MKKFGIKQLSDRVGCGNYQKDKVRLRQRKPVNYIHQTDKMLSTQKKMFKHVTSTKIQFKVATFYSSILVQ